MSKHINKSRIVCFILTIFCILSLLSFINVYNAEASLSYGNINDFNSGSALQASSSLFGTVKCSCAPKYSYIKEERVTSSGASNYGEIVGTAITLDYSSSLSSSNSCVYTGTTTVTVPCNSSNGTAYLQKYINAGIFGNDSQTNTRANDFYNDAYTYASYVQMGLSSKTQAGGGILSNKSDWSDLGNGRFQKAMFDFNNNAHYVYSFLIGFAFITAMLVFILIFMKITWLPDHPIKRREAMEDIVTSGVSVILTGGIWIVISLFQSIFDRFWSSYAVYSKDWKTVANMFLYEYKGLVVGILGIAALTALLMFIKNFVGLSFSGDNPSARKQKMISILFCGIATAGLGALTIVMGFFWNVL